MLRIYFDGLGPRQRGWVYRFEHGDGRDESGSIGSLDALARVLQAWGEHLVDLPWTELPTFGGKTPHSTRGVWSWDETRLLVGESAAEVVLVGRTEGGAGEERSADAEALGAAGRTAGG